jgi:ketosteroid isomerase-like protein
MAMLWKFRDGLIVRMEMYADRAAACRAAGIPE